MKTVSNWIWLTWREPHTTLICQEMSFFIFILRLIQSAQCERNCLSGNEDSVLVIDGHPQSVRTPKLTVLTLLASISCTHSGLHYDFVMKSHQYYIDLKLMKRFLTNILDFDVLSKAFDGINVFDFWLWFVLIQSTKQLLTIQACSFQQMNCY